jgi:hypothetical protein
MGIPTSQNPDTLEGLENWLSVGIRKILAELPHSTEPELRKLRARATPRCPEKSGSPPALRPSPLSQFYKNELGSAIGG